jgi:hypothetical protein
MFSGKGKGEVSNCGNSYDEGQGQPQIQRTNTNFKAHFP